MSEPKAFRTRVHEVKAILWDGMDASWEAIVRWAGDAVEVDGDRIICETPDGTLDAFPGDWIVNQEGIFFPMDGEIFSRKFEVENV